jgi:hypothetical protein
VRFPDYPLVIVILVVAGLFAIPDHEELVKFLLELALISRIPPWN